MVRGWLLKPACAITEKKIKEKVRLRNNYHIPVSRTALIGHQAEKYSAQIKTLFDKCLQKTKEPRH